MIPHILGFLLGQQGELLSTTLMIPHILGFLLGQQGELLSTTLMIPHILGFLLGQQGELLRLVENYLDDSSHTWIPPRTVRRTPWTS